MKRSQNLDFVHRNPRHGPAGRRVCRIVAKTRRSSSIPRVKLSVPAWAAPTWVMIELAGGVIESRMEAPCGGCCCFCWPSRPARQAAQDLGTLDPKPLPPLTNPNDPKLPAQGIFRRNTEPLPSRRVDRVLFQGLYRWCRCAADQWPTWQVMRLSRNRNWGHPDLIALIERLSAKAQKAAGWPGF